MFRWLAKGLMGALGTVLVAVPMAVAAPSPGSPGQGLEISPPVLELAANPGQTVTATIRVRNITRGQLTAKGKADDFGPGMDESGQPKILLDETEATRYSLKYWVSGVTDLRLAPQELKATTIQIRVPANAEPGGHFGVVRFTAVPPELEGTGVALSASVGTLVLMRVSGQVTDRLSLEEFSLAREGRKGSFFETGPLDFVVRVKNDGTVHEKVQGSIKIKNMFGAQEAELKVNERGGNVLPGSIRKFEAAWERKQLFGHYTATLKMNYASGKSLEQTLGFWIIPWKLIVLGLIGLVAIGWVLRLGVRRYNEHIIAQSRRRTRAGE